MSDRPAPTLSSAKLALAVRQMRAEGANLSLLASDPIAIVGIGCRFPGEVRSAADYWHMLHNGVDAITTIPPERWNADDYFAADPHAPGKMNSRWGGFVSQVDQFDPLLFGISPREAASMDPQQRLLLEVVWEAIWDSGRSPESLASSAAGVFMAVYNSDYSRLLYEEERAIGAHTVSGASHSIASGRISFLLDLHGPSLSIDTACSSSLVAVHLACQSLRAGECNVALTGGVALHLTPEHYIAMAKIGMLAPDGRCKTFDSSANGFVPGEGCGVVVLKLLADALKDGDHVYAVIRGTAVNQDGRTNVLTAPNGLAQREVIRAALRNGQVQPHAVSYIEAHGTGTALGDPIEVEALAEVIGANPGNAVPCALGAVKSNMGHLEAAAGIAGMIKAALSLEHEEIPPNLHYRQLNSNISLQDTRFFIPTQPTPWPRGAQARFAGTSSFGFGGTNAHVILEEAPQIPQRSGDATMAVGRGYTLPISARTPEALRDFARAYQDFLTADARDEKPFYDVCHSASTRRYHYEERLAAHGANTVEICQSLQDFAEGRTNRNVISGRASHDGEGLVFLCSGQGSQWPGMGTSLFKNEPVFRAAIEECEELIQRATGWSLIEQLSATKDVSKLQDTEIAQPALFALEIALARLWRSWGVIPSAIIGHSAGEVAAAHIAGVLDLQEAVRVVVHRGRLMQAATGLGSMAAIRLPLSEVEAALRPFGEQISIAAINSPESVVISGASEIVKRLTTEWLGKGVGCRVLPVNYAFHSAQMDPFSKELARTLGRVTTHPQTVPIISTVFGAATDGAQFNENYWAQNVRKPVLFAKAISAATQMGLGTFLEVGPHPVLLSNVGECLGSAARREHLIPSLQRNSNECESMRAFLGRLYVIGCPVEWNSIYPTRVSPVSLPPYPYQRTRYWIDQRPKSEANGTPSLHGSRLRSPSLRSDVYETRIGVSSLPYLADHQIEGALLLPMTAFLEIANDAVAKSAGGRRTLADVAVLHPLILPAEGLCTLQTIVEDSQFKIFSLNGENWTLHASGRITDAVALAQVPSPATLAEALDPVETEDFYSRLRDRGLQFGPSFRVLQTLRASDGEAVGKVVLGDREKHEVGDYNIHPALLDGCLQTVLAAAPQNLNGTYIPFGIDQFDLLASVGASAWAQARIRPVSDASMISADVDVTNESGKLLARVAGLHLKRRNSLSAVAQNIYRLQWRPAGPTNHSPQKNEYWAIVADDANEGVKLADALREEGCRTLLLQPGNSVSADKQIQGVIRLFTARPSESPADASLEACESVLSLTQDLLKHFPARPPRLCLATRGAISAQPADRVPTFSLVTVWGLARTIALEHPDLHCLRIDLDPDIQDFAPLAAELCASEQAEEIAFRAGERYLPQLAPIRAREAGPQRLVVSTRGSIENLTSEPIERREPSPGEVEVEVETTGLNFRDVLSVLGTYPGDPGPLGLEFCGRIARVGENIREFAVDDRVMGIAWGSFASFVNTPAALVVRVPDEINTAEAASIPNAFLTAYHCLVELGKMKRGDRVLIHAATGGVGLAAVQLAKQAGAEIFATAGSERKREYLRSLGIQNVYNSRTLNFKRDILERTGGRGVDLLLNSLAGDFIEAGFEVVAEGGHFIEIGKSGIWSAEQAAARFKSVRYSVVDLAPVIDETPALIQSHLAVISRGIADGSLRPLPVSVFEMDDAPSAFRTMAQAKHIGKIVLRHPAPLRISPDFTYLITGGLGALGLLAAEWMITKGARNLLLISRSNPNDEASRRIAAMRDEDAQIEVRSADISNQTEIATILRETEQSMPPLRGVFHAAGIVGDGVIAQQSWSRFAKVMAPKVTGGWNLHQLTEGKPLDFFVLFSSVASLTGSPGQASYSAGNAFLDALAHHRRTLGLPALSINWGAWANSGMAARVEAQGRRRALDVIRPMSSENCFTALQAAAEQGDAQLAVVDADWPQWKNPPRLIANLAQRGSTSAAVAPVNDILHRLEAAPSASRRGILLDFLREEALRVLGLSATHFIDEKQPLIKMGLDSLMAVEFRNRLTATLKRPLTATLLFDYPTLGQLANHLGANDASQTEREADPLMAELGSLTDEQAEELLREELRHS